MKKYSHIVLFLWQILLSCPEYWTNEELYFYLVDIHVFHVFISNPNINTYLCVYNENNSKL